MKKGLLTSIASLSLICSLTAQTPKGKATFIEKVENQEGKLVVPYEKYKLDNGLTLLIQEDHSDPMVHVEVIYHVGSTRDEAGRSGFAHFFEHMMFEGSDHVAPGELHKIIGDAGGTNNGNTTVDRTVYFETVPANYLETALWLESDRMGFFLDAVTAKKFGLQRAIVKNERGQNYDNKPYGLVDEKVFSALYPVTNPYFTPTIGYIEDLNRADVNELKRFFLRWYGPNNATLIVAGDVDPKTVVALTEKYFGSIVSGPPIPKLKVEPVKLEGNRYVSYEDNIRNPMLEMVFPTIPTHHPDEAALDILADILGGTGTNLLYRAFVGGSEPTASSIDASHPCYEATGRFEITITALPGEDLADIEKNVRRVFNDFEARGVTDDDMVKFKADYMTKFFDRMTTIKGKAERLGYFEWLHGNPDMFQSEYERYMNVKKADVMYVYEKYIKDQPAVILSVYPKGKSKIIAKKDNYLIPKRTALAPEEAEYKNLVYTKSTDNFDRSKRPAVGPDPEVKVPEIWQQEFANGMKLMGIYNNEIPCVTLHISIDAGHTNETRDNAGVATLVARMFNESTEFHRGVYYSTELKKLGSEIYIEPRVDDLLVTVTSTKANLSATLLLLQEKLFSLKFVDSEFDWEKNRLLDRIASQAKTSSVLADNMFLKLVYDNNSIGGTPIIGTTASIRDISLRDVKKYYKSNFLPNNARLMVVGDIRMDELLPKLDFLRDWEAGELKKEAKPIVPAAIDKTRIYFVNKENAAQSEIRIGCAAPAYNPIGEQYKCTIMNGPLGEGFSCRINQNLREENGFSYGAHSYFLATKYMGRFVARSSVKSGQTDSAIVELMKEIKLYADKGVTENELEQTKKSFVLNEALSYESPDQKADLLWRLQYYNLDKNYMKKRQEILAGLHKPETDALAKKYLPYNNMVIVVVGDRSVYAKLQALGYELTELDPDGKTVSH